MPDSRIARNPLGKLNASLRCSTLKQFLCALMSEVEPDLKINDRFAQYTKAEMTRFNDPGVDWTNWNFVYPFTGNRTKREARPFVSEIGRRYGVFAQRKIIARPKSVAHQWPQVRMADWFNAEQVKNFAFE